MNRILAAIFRPAILFTLVVGGCGFLIGAFIVGKEAAATIFEVTILGTLLLVGAFASLIGFFLLLSRW